MNFREEHNRTMRMNSKLSKKLKYILFRNVNEIASMWCRDQIAKQFYVKGNLLHHDVEFSEYRDNWEYDEVPLGRMDWAIIFNVNSRDINGELYEGDTMELATLMMDIARIGVSGCRLGEVNLDELEEMEPY